MRSADCEPASVLGWDIGGAHVKAALFVAGELRDAAQWPCPLWQGLQHLQAALGAARGRWPQLDRCRHAVTMTGEMVDLFAHREEGVARIAALLAAMLPAPRFFAGDAGWVGAGEAVASWPQVASANWLATATHAAQVLADREGLLVDIGSTTTDLVAFRAGRVLTSSRSDAERLAASELVYHGVVRTPLCVLARRMPWRGAMLNVMNEFFATTADVYRLSGELDPAHDQQPSADNAPKTVTATQTRLARLIGLDQRDGSDAEWRAFALAWREAQCRELREQIERVAADQRLGARTVVVAAGCGAFLVPDVVPAGWTVLDHGRDVVRCADPAVAAWASVGAAAAAVGALYSTGPH